MKPEGLNNIVVVGAGSAGWMTALFIQKLFPKCNITIIGSRELGILGAGEGTVPSIKEFLKAVDIHPYNLIKRCKSTVKLGIKFANWRGDGKHYHHTFGRPHPAFVKLNHPHKSGLQLLSEFPLDKSFIEAQCFVNDLNCYDYDFTDRHIESLKVPLQKNAPIESLLTSNNLGIAWHFDAIEIAKYFEEIGISRGIKYIDDYVNSFDQDSNGYITKVNLNNGSVDCDFIFDCSGFKRLIIGKLYNSEWIDLTDRLTVNRALPFFLPPDNVLKNHTTATAMNNGWVWEIPLQHRSGCGYVFNSNFCDDEMAKKELYAKYGNDIEIPKSFSFNAGYFKQTWIKNCIAIGLSTGFVEPMEATSIWGSAYGLKSMVVASNLLPKANQETIDYYNQKITRFNEEVAAFIQYHYFSDRRDTEFWRDINNNKPIPNRFKTLFNLWQNRMPCEIDTIDVGGFNVYSWVKVGLGIGFFDKGKVRKQIEDWQEYYHEFNEQNIQMHLTKMNAELDRHTLHQQFLELVVGKEQLEENRKLIFK